MVLILRKTGPRSSDSGRKKVGTGAYIPGLRGLKTTDSRDGMGRRRGCPPCLLDLSKPAMRAVSDRDTARLSARETTAYIHP